MVLRSDRAGDGGCPVPAAQATDDGWRLRVAVGTAGRGQRGHSVNEPAAGAVDWRGAHGVAGRLERVNYLRRCEAGLLVQHQCGQSGRMGRCCRGAVEAVSPRDEVTEEAVLPTVGGRHVDGGRLARTQCRGWRGTDDRAPAVLRGPPRRVVLQHRAVVVRHGRNRGAGDGCVVPEDRRADDVASGARVELHTCQVRTVGDELEPGGPRGGVADHHQGGGSGPVPGDEFAGYLRVEVVLGRTLDQCVGSVQRAHVEVRAHAELGFVPAQRVPIERADVDVVGAVGADGAEVMAGHGGDVEGGDGGGTRRRPVCRGLVGSDPVTPDDDVRVGR